MRADTFNSLCRWNEGVKETAVRRHIRMYCEIKVHVLFYVYSIDLSFYVFNCFEFDIFMYCLLIVGRSAERHSWLVLSQEKL